MLVKKPANRISAVPAGPESICVREEGPEREEGGAGETVDAWDGRNLSRSDRRRTPCLRAIPLLLQLGILPSSRMGGGLARTQHSSS